MTSLPRDFCKTVGVFIGQGAKFEGVPRINENLEIPILGVSRYFWHFSRFILITLFVI